MASCLLPYLSRAKGDLSVVELRGFCQCVLFCGLIIYVGPVFHAKSVIFSARKLMCLAFDQRKRTIELLQMFMPIDFLYEFCKEFPSLL